MYLDHLKANANRANAEAATESLPMVSFSECLEAALYCTEVHSAADAYLIKAEAEYMYASESGDEKAEGGFWAKIKAVVKKMWEALKTLVAKGIAYIKTLPAKITNVARRIGAKFNSIGVAKKLEAVKDKTPDAKAVADAKYLDLSKLSAQFKNEVIDAIDAAKNEDDMGGNSNVIDSKLKELREEVEKTDSKFWVAVDTYAAAKAIVDKIGDVAKDVDTTLAGIQASLDAANKAADNTVKRFQKLYDAKDEDGVKKVTKELAGYRTAAVKYIKAGQMFATFASKSIFTKVNAVKKYIAACGSVAEKPAEKPAKKPAEAKK